jgi:hypothetical protein
LTSKRSGIGYANVTRVAQRRDRARRSTEHQEPGEKEERFAFGSSRRHEGNVCAKASSPRVILLRIAPFQCEITPQQGWKLYTFLRANSRRPGATRAAVLKGY